jgi:hypothetical protein
VQPDPHDQVAVRIDDELVIWTPRGFEAEVRAVFAEDPTLRDRLVDQERQRASVDLKLIRDVEVRRRLLELGVPLGDEPSS